jgi:hypothetical protein
MRLGRPAPVSGIGSGTGVSLQLLSEPIAISDVLGLKYFKLRQSFVVSRIQSVALEEAINAAIEGAHAGGEIGFPPWTSASDLYPQVIGAYSESQRAIVTSQTKATIKRKTAAIGANWRYWKPSVGLRLSLSGRSWANECDGHPVFSRRFGGWSRLR